MFFRKVVDIFNVAGDSVSRGNSDVCMHHTKDVVVWWVFEHLVRVVTLCRPYDLFQSQAAIGVHTPLNEGNERSLFHARLAVILRLAFLEVSDEIRCTVIMERLIDCHFELATAELLDQKIL